MVERLGQCICIIYIYTYRNTLICLPHARIYGPGVEAAIVRLARARDYVLMLRRGRVRPEIDPYIRLRYEDTAIWIHYDLKAGRGMHSYYAPWLESMIQILSPESREKYSLMGAVALPPIPVAVTAEQTLLTDNHAHGNNTQPPRLVAETQHQSKFCVIL